MSSSAPRLHANGPLVTVYITSRNYGRYLPQAVTSVLVQLYPVWELFIIDDASTDDTRVIAERFARDHAERIHVIANETPLGVQRIANDVLRRCAGRYIVRLDADDWFDESALLLMVSKLESDPTLGLVYGNYFYTDASGRVTGVERRRTLGTEDTAGHVPAHGACTMVRTRVLKAVGGYSEEVDAQDGWDLWHKVIPRVKAASLEAPLFYYRQHASSLSRDASRLLNARARIMSQARSRMDGPYAPSCFAVIPVRESYPGFEGVPFRQVGGRTLLDLALHSASEADRITEFAVSSESDRVLDASADMIRRGQVRPHMQITRSTESGQSHIRVREILLHACEAYQFAHGTHPDIVVFLSLHAPLRRGVHIDRVIDTLRIHCCDSVVSVAEDQEPTFAHGREGLRLLNPGRFDELAYERERLYKFNGTALAMWWEILAEGHLFGDSVGYVEMSENESVQVKTVADLERLRPLVAEDEHV